MCWICLFFVSLSFFLNHRFCENAELRASFHHVKTLFFFPVSMFICMSQLTRAHVCSVLTPAVLLAVCMIQHPQALFPPASVQTHTGAVPQPGEVTGSLLQCHSDLRQGLAVIYWAAMGCHSWIFCLSHRNNNSACSPHKWYFCRQCLMHVTPVCAGAGYPKQGKPMHSSSSGSTMKFFPAF